MAKTNRNFLTHNYIGKVGKQYSLRNRGDNSIIAQLPKIKKVSAATALTRAAIQEKFQRAVIYATTAMKNAVLKQEYTAKRRGTQTAFNVAFLDAYNGPVLSDLRTDRYEGIPGQTMLVEAKDNFRVKSVRFTLHSAGGVKIEEGDAVLAANGFHWVYTVQVNNLSVPGTIVRITATDVPDNQTILEKVL